jgi:hypothetical protein
MPVPKPNEEYGPSWSNIDEWLEELGNLHGGVAWITAVREARPGGPGGLYWMVKWTGDPRRVHAGGDRQRGGYAGKHGPKTVPGLLYRLCMELDAQLTQEEQEAATQAVF